MVSDWSRAAFARSQVTPLHIPVGFSLPRQKNFAWKHNGQIRYIKLYCHIILFSPTEKPNLNSGPKTIPNPKNLLWQVNNQNPNLSKMPHKNYKTKKLLRKKSRALPSALTSAQINQNNKLNLNLQITNHNFPCPTGHSIPEFMANLNRPNSSEESSRTLLKHQESDPNNCSSSPRPSAISKLSTANLGSNPSQPAQQDAHFNALANIHKDMHINDQNISQSDQLLTDIPAIDISTHLNIFNNNQYNPHPIILQNNTPYGDHYLNNIPNNACLPLSSITEYYDSNDSGQGTQALPQLEHQSTHNHH